MTFQIGEKVVYPNHGVGTIENISARSFGIQNEKFYLLKLAYNSLTVMVPFSHVEQVGLRKVTQNGEIARVLNYLATGEIIASHDWKDRFKENSVKMQNGSLLEVAEVLKCLVRLQSMKPLSFREKKMLERARGHAVDRDCHVERRGRTGRGEPARQGASQSESSIP